VAKPAKLRAHDLVLSGRRCSEMHRQIQARNKILLYAQFAYVKGMSNILGVHQKQHFAIHGNCEFASNDVISRFHVVGRIKTKEVGISFIDLVRMQSTKLSVRARIAEVKGKL